MKRIFGTTWKILKATIRELSENDPFRMAGATAFFTTFALPAMLMIIVQTLGLFMGRQTVGRQIGTQLRSILGEDSMNSILKAIRSFRSMEHSVLISIGLFTFLFFVATTLFKIIKNSINEIWNIESRPHGKVMTMLKSRAISVAVILLGGILFLCVQLVDAGQRMFGDYLVRELPYTTFYLGSVLNIAVVILVSTLWFYVLFIFMPDGKPSGKIVLGGAFITACLFNAGKMMLRELLSPGRLNNFYGASGALVLVLLFVFYSSIILYFGAALIKVLGDTFGHPVMPKPHAAKYRVEIIDEA